MAALRLLPSLLSKPAGFYRPVALLNQTYLNVHNFGSSSPYTLAYRSYSKKKPKKQKRGNVRQVEDDEDDGKDADGKEKSGTDADSKDIKDKDSSDTKETKSTKDTKDTKEAKDTKDTKSNKTSRISKKDKASQEFKSSGNVLDDTIRQIEQAFGKGALMKLTNSSLNVKLEPDEVIPTGSLGLDLALGVGGLPVGRVAEIYGPESSGKTTLALHVIAEAQRRGKYCAFIDSEHALNPQWAAKLGVNTDELLISQPDSGEQALEIADSLIKAGKTNVIVIDSVAALVPKVELEGEMGDTHIGVQARLMSQALRKISPSLTKSKCVLIFINQIRMKIGVMFGNPETTTGGNALKFYSSIRRIGSVKRGEDIIGNQIRVKVAKNKLAPPFKEALFDIDFGKGISKLGEVIDWGVKSRVLEKMGAWYAYQGTQIGQGREKTKAYLEEHPDVAQEIEESIREKLLKGEVLGQEEEPSEPAEEEKASE